MAERRIVGPHPDGGWQVKTGADRASSRHERQSDAIDRAREILGNVGGGELTVQGSDRKIRDFGYGPAWARPVPAER